MTGASMVGPLTEELASRSRDSLRRELRLMRTTREEADAAREAWLEEALLRSWLAMQQEAA